jgi:hypothetical protein
MRMSELLEAHAAKRRAPADALVEALAVTGPLIHGGFTYTGVIRDGEHRMCRTSKPVAGARQAATVDVPERPSA